MHANTAAQTLSRYGWQSRPKVRAKPKEDGAKHMQTINPLDTTNSTRPAHVGCCRPVSTVQAMQYLHSPAASGPDPRNPDA